jgi:hypothetical protein
MSEHHQYCAIDKLTALDGLPIISSNDTAEVIFTDAL